MAVSKKKQTKKVALLARVVLVLFALWAAYRFVDINMQQEQRRQEVALLSARHEALSIHNAELNRQVARDLSLEEIDRIAREQLDMVSPDQRVFIDISGR